MNLRRWALAIGVTGMWAATFTPSLAQNTTWTHVDADNVLTGEWSTAGNWNNGVPGVGQSTALLTNKLNSYVVNVDTAPAAFYSLLMNNTAPYTATLNINTNMIVGTYGFTNHMYQNTAINVNAGLARMYMGVSARGTFVVQNGATLYQRSATATAGGLAGASVTVRTNSLWETYAGQMAGGTRITIEPGGRWNYLAQSRIPYFGAATPAIVITNRGTIYHGVGTQFYFGSTGATTFFHELFLEEGSLFTLNHLSATFYLAYGGGQSANTQARITLNGGTMDNLKNSALYCSTSADTYNQNGRAFTQVGEIIVNDGEWRWGTGGLYLGGWNGNAVTNVSLNAYNTMRAYLIQTGGLFRTLGDVFLGRGPSQGHIDVSGGVFYATNAAGTSTILVSAYANPANYPNPPIGPGRGYLTLSGGAMTVDRLVATNGATYSFLQFDGGTLAVKSAIVSNGAVLAVGNGTNTATLALLSGTHAFEAGLTVSSNATLAVQSAGATGSAAVLGNVALGAGSTLHVDVAGAADHDALNVTGSVTLDGTLDLNLLAYAPPRGQSWTIISTTGGASGAFDSLPAGYTVSLAGNDVVLEHARIGTVILVK